MFHDYHGIHLLAKDADGKLVEDRPLPFRLRTGAYSLGRAKEGGARFRGRPHCGGRREFGIIRNSVPKDGADTAENRDHKQTQTNE